MERIAMEMIAFLVSISRFMRRFQRMIWYSMDKVPCN